MSPSASPAPCAGWSAACWRRCSIVGLVFAVTNLGSLFKSDPQANNATTGSQHIRRRTSVRPARHRPALCTGRDRRPSRASPARAISTLPRPTTWTWSRRLTATRRATGRTWSSPRKDWGGLAPDGVPLVVKLKSPAKVSSITLSQLGASGGNISVFTNDRPSLDGAKQVGTNSFTSPDLTMPLAEPVQAQYVIVSIKTLPKLAAPKTRYGYGLRLAEIKIQ